MRNHVRYHEIFDIPHDVAPKIREDMIRRLLISLREQIKEMYGDVQEERRGNSYGFNANGREAGRMIIFRGRLGWRIYSPGEQPALPFF